MLISFQCDLSFSPLNNANLNQIHLYKTMYRINLGVITMWQYSVSLHNEMWTDYKTFTPITIFLIKEYCCCCSLHQNKYKIWLLVDSTLCYRNYNYKHKKEKNIILQQSILRIKKIEREKKRRMNVQQIEYIHLGHFQQICNYNARNPRGLTRVKMGRRDSQVVLLQVWHLQNPSLEEILRLHQ